MKLYTPMIFAVRRKTLLNSREPYTLFFCDTNWIVNVLLIFVLGTINTSGLNSKLLTTLDCTRPSRMCLCVLSDMRMCAFVLAFAYRIGKPWHFTAWMYKYLFVSCWLMYRSDSHTGGGSDMFAIH